MNIGVNSKRARLDKLLIVLVALVLAISPSHGEEGKSPKQQSIIHKAARFGGHTDRILGELSASGGICVLLGDAKCRLAVELAQQTELLIYVQLTREKEVRAARRAADAAGFYGTRIFVERGDFTRIHLADNLADVVVAVDDAQGISEPEALRVLRPQGVALLGSRKLTKAFPERVDDWSHPYHGPDNNPQSSDAVIRAPYLTQFLAEPRFASSPQVAVASAGRVFKAFGNVAWHKREEPFLNTLVAFNGYNGTLLWKRPLTPGYMIHRNTIIATPTTLYVADDKSCKLIDAATGELRAEIAPSAEVAGGTFWKWMALEDNVLYALIGKREQGDPLTLWRREAHGWPWGEVSRGYDQSEQPWGFGRTLLAIDPETQSVLWCHREEEPIDARAVCMKNGRIYIFRFGAFLACLDAKTGETLWRKNRDNAPELFDSLGTYLTRQSWRTNWRTAAYLKCSDKALYFAGPQIGKLLAVSAEDGRILWEHPYDNFQLILRDDALYGISGPWRNNVSKKFDPLTGEVLAEFVIGRRACTRPTASLDSIFFRAMGGSVRFDLASYRPQWISPMRPSCHDGVTIANGLLYWWPWACDCQLTLYGVTCLGPAGDFDFYQPATEADRLEQVAGNPAKIAALPQSEADWPTFRGNNKCSATTEAALSERGKLSWQFTPDTTNGLTLTAPVAVGGLVFLSGSDGIVRALDADTGRLRWTAYTGGSVRIPPTIWEDRALVSSGDGWVYAFEARTGRLLWRFRAAPAERKIPVYGSLLSTWPAASGALVQDGVAYVSAGIVNYDGTYVYALDAATGRIRWENNTSGHLDSDANTGVSVQGHMLLHDDKLYLAGGNALSPAAYNITDGQCLNDPEPLQQCESISPRGWELFLVGDRVVACGTSFYTPAEYSIYDRTVFKKMLHASTGHRDIIWLDNQKLMCFAPLDKDSLSGCVQVKREYTGHIIPPWGNFDALDKLLWEYECEKSLAVALCRNAVLVAMETEIVALDLQDGKELWARPLPSAPVPWGLAVNRDGRAVVTLEDGQVLCWG